MDFKKIPTFVLNLEKRNDRRKHIIDDFSGKAEFDIQFVVPIFNEHPSVSIWKTIKYVINDLLPLDANFVLICEDDHFFTANYSKALLFDCIKSTQKLGAEILLGGVSCFGDIIYAEQNILCIREFTGLQFTVIFRQLFQRINDFEFKEHHDADIVISNIAKRIFVINPFISRQKEFGYSDVTALNNGFGRVSNLFTIAERKAAVLVEVSSFYKKKISNINREKSDLTNNVFIPTYIINLQERKQRLMHILAQFSGKSEFAVNVVNAIKHKNGNLGLWLTIRKIVAQALEQDHDVILICEDDHEFSLEYSRSKFLNSVVRAHELGAAILLGGIGNCQNAIYVDKELVWIDSFYCTQFTVLYKKVFKKILEEPFDKTVTADGILSMITSHKLLIHPLISFQRHFDQSDINPVNLVKGHLERMFAVTSQRIESITDAQRNYLNSD